VILLKNQDFVSYDRQCVGGFARLEFNQDELTAVLKYRDRCFESLAAIALELFGEKDKYKLFARKVCPVLAQCREELAECAWIVTKPSGC
jgi:hypothetical protein